MDVFEYHSKSKGKIKIETSSPIENTEDLSLAYTPGVAEISKAIAENPEKVYEYTIKSHTVAIVSDGSAVLGLGNIGAKAAIPVMEGKAALFKTFAGIDAFPICIESQTPSEIISIVKNISPIFGGINLEDISAPRCFEIEESLQNLGIPVMHDDQHGTAVVVLAGLINAAKVTNKRLGNLIVVVNGSGAAGTAIAKLLSQKVKSVIVVDSRGIICSSRKDLNPFKRHLTEITNKENISGNLTAAMKGADVFIGVSKANLLTSDDISLMANDPIIFALANPIPEISPDEAKKGGARIVATGRSDMPNQVNNSLAFPGIFKGALEIRATKITESMKLAAAEALASMVDEPSVEMIVPKPFDPGIAEAVAKAVKKAA